MHAGGWAEQGRAIPVEPGQAVVFDLDGVITRTARQHFEAWKAVLDPVLASRGQRPFDENDYVEQVDGVSRREGLVRLLKSRGLDLAQDALDGLARAKNEAYLRALQRAGVQVFPDAARLLHELHAAGDPAAVISASRSGRRVLEAAGLSELVATVVDGVEQERMGLRGKPAPDVFIEAARRLGVPPRCALAVEDARAGVRAARAAGFEKVLGLTRNAPPALLLEAGADRVASDLDRVVALRPMASLPAALLRQEEILGRFPGKPRAIFLDLDGTLAPIVTRAPDARVPDGTLGTLQRLARTSTVAVVSGRDMDSLKRLTGIPGVLLAAEHGLVIEGPGGESFVHPAAGAGAAAMEEVGPRLRDAVSAVPGAWIESKRFSLVVHDREVAAASVPALHEEVLRIAAAEPRLKVRPGKRVLELQPALDWNKGSAVAWLLDRLGLGPGAVHVVCAGDDLTDEDAFLAIGASGTCVVVGSGPRLTAARYAVADPAELEALLRTMAEAP